MKRIIVAVILGILMMASPTAPSATAKMNNEEVMASINEIKQGLPMYINEAITWKSIELMPNGEVEFVYLVNPTTLGVQIKDFANAMEQVSSAQMYDLLGEEFKAMSEKIGRNLKIVYEYPDGSKTIKHITLL